MLHRLLVVIIIAVTALVTPDGVAGANDARKIRSQQQTARKEIRRNQSRLKSNRREINRQLSRLQTLHTEIGASDYEISRLESDMADIDRGVAITHASIDSLTAELHRLRSGYKNTLRKMQAQRPVTNPLGFILSARSTTEFIARVRYVRQLSRWRQRRERQIEDVAVALGAKRSELEGYRKARLTTLGQLNDNRARLAQRQSETDRLITKLKAEGGELQAAIDKRQAQLKTLDNQLNRIIEADRKAREKRQAEARKREQEARQKRSQKQSQKPTVGQTGKAGKPDDTGGRSREAATSEAEADRKLTGSFESNRGRLLFPVSGSYRVTRGFGKSYYNSRVQTSHIGVDLQVASGTKARAIFEGVVTNVSRLDGFNTIVVVRHGSYLTVYVNLTDVGVKTGQRLKAGQIIGTVATDADGRHATLQFGLRRERTELNPLQWVK